MGNSGKRSQSRANATTDASGEVLARASNAYARAMLGSIFLTVFVLRWPGGIDLMNVLLLLAGVSSVVWSISECGKAGAALKEPDKREPAKAVAATLVFGTSAAMAVWTFLYDGMTFLGAFSAAVALVSLVGAATISQRLKTKL